MLYQLVTTFGAILILTAFAGAQRGFLPLTSWRSAIMNFVGGASLTAAAVSREQWGFVLLEGAWTLVATWSLQQCYRRSRERAS